MSNELAKLGTDELLDSQTHIWNQMFSFINSTTLICAVKLDIPDIINKHGKPMKLSELVDALQISKSKHQFVYRLMRTLIHSKYFISVKILSNDNGEVEGYWLTPLSRLLLKDEPMSLTPWLLGVSDPYFSYPLLGMSEWLKSESSSTPFEFAHGKDFWEFVGEEPMLNNLFNKAMNSDSVLVGNVVMEKCKHVFEGLTSIVDVAGGTGVMAKAIADAWPDLKCTVLDLPHVVSGLEGRKNLIYVGGNMFDFIPSADAVLLKWILHDWGDDECVKILKKCKEAITNDKGKLIIIDMVINLDDDNKNEAAIETQLCFDIAMMNMHGGKERSEKEWANMFSQAGFTTYKITHRVLGLRSIIEVFP